MLATQRARLQLVAAAVLFAVASLPTFLFLRERALPQASADGIVRTAWARLAATVRSGISAPRRRAYSPTASGISRCHGTPSAPDAASCSGAI